MFPSATKRTNLSLKNFNLHTEPGRRIAIVGPTGCGKTTFINLLMRFYDVTGGSISVDGTPITDVSRHALRGSYGMVLQDTWIKHGTVRDNICIGKPDSSDEDVIQAAKMSTAGNLSAVFQMAWIPFFMKTA